MKSNETNWRDNHFENSEFFAIFIRQQRTYNKKAAPKDTKIKANFNEIMYDFIPAPGKWKKNKLFARENKTKPNIGQQNMWDD